MMSISRNRKKYIIYPKDYDYRKNHKYQSASSKLQAKKIADKMGVGAQIWTQRLKQNGSSISFWNFDQEYLEVT